MTTDQQAMEMILELGRTASEVTKQTNSRHGGVTKKSVLEERKAIIALWKALTGKHPSEEQINTATFG